jgi:hypothetical protein
MSERPDRLESLDTPDTPVSSLTQTFRFCRREFVLHRDQVLVRTAGWDEASEYSVSLESLAPRPYRVANGPRWLGGLAAFSLLVALAAPLALGAGQIAAALSLVGALAFLCLGGAYYLSFRSWVVLPGTEMDLLFFASQPAPESVGAFVEAVLEQREDLLSERDGGDADQTMVDDLERLSWLGEQGFLTEDEIEVLKERLTGLGADGFPSRGEGPVN